MNIDTILVVVVFFLLSAYISFLIVKRVVARFFPDNILRVTTIATDGSKVIEVFNLDELTPEQITQLEVRLKNKVHRSGDQ